MTEDFLIAYFLGELSEIESRRLEEECLRQEELFDRLHSTEEALIDAYVRGELDVENRTRFEQNYLNTQGRRETVALATTLMKKYNAAAIARVPTPTRFLAVLPRLRGVWFRNNLGWSSALAALSLLVITIGLWSIWRRDNPPSVQTGGTIKPSTVQSTPRLASASPSPAQASLASPGATPSSIPSLQRSAKNKPTVSGQSASVIATFALLPGGVRSEDATGKVLNLPPDVTMVRLQLVLKGNYFTHYRAELQTPEGATVFKRGNLVSIAVEKHRTVTLEIAPRLLESRHYVLILSGENNATPEEPVGEYVFKVIRQ